MAAARIFGYTKVIQKIRGHPDALDIARRHREPGNHLTLWSLLHGRDIDFRHRQLASRAVEHEEDTVLPVDNRFGCRRHFGPCL